MQTFLVAVAFAVAVYYLYRRLRRAFSGKGGCGCGCSGCASRRVTTPRPHRGTLVIPKYEGGHDGRSA